MPTSGVRGQASSLNKPVVGSWQLRELNAGSAVRTDAHAMMQPCRPPRSLLLTGSPGCGKTTVAPLVADRHERSVCLDLDWFFAKLRSGAIEPVAGGGARAEPGRAARRGRSGGRLRRRGLRHRRRGHPLPVHARPVRSCLRPQRRHASTTRCCAPRLRSCSSGSRTARSSPSTQERWPTPTVVERPLDPVREPGRRRAAPGRRGPARPGRGGRGDRPPAAGRRVPARTRREPEAPGVRSRRRRAAAWWCCARGPCRRSAAGACRTSPPLPRTTRSTWSSTACRRTAGRRRWRRSGRSPC